MANENIINLDLLTRYDEKIKDYINNKAPDAGVYKFKGTVTNYSDLPSTNNQVGDVYNVSSLDGMNYAWTGTDWDALGASVDLSEYLLKSDAIGKKGSNTGAEIFNDYTDNVVSGDYAHAEGRKTTAIGSFSHAEGGETTALSNFAHVEGYLTEAKYAAHAEGQNTKAYGNNSHAEGKKTTAEGGNAHAEGDNTLAKGNNSHTEGEQTKAYGADSHAEGYASQSGGTSAPSALNNATVGYFAHAEGNGTWAYGNSSHTEGFETKAKNQAAHAEGNNTVAEGTNSHAEGNSTFAQGNNSHAEGENTKAYAGDSHTEGYRTITGTPLDSDFNEVLNAATTTVAGGYAHAEGNATWADGVAAHAEGISTHAAGKGSHSEGNYTQASGDYSHAEGVGVEVYAGEMDTDSIDSYSCTVYCTLTGAPLAIGDFICYNNGTRMRTTRVVSIENADGVIQRLKTAKPIQTSLTGALDIYKIVFNTASGKASHVSGIGTQATAEAQTVVGKHNAEDNNALFIVGNGEDTDNRNNAFVVKSDNTAELNNVKIATVNDIPDTSKFVTNSECTLNGYGDGYSDKATAYISTNAEPLSDFNGTATIKLEATGSSGSVSSYIEIQNEGNDVGYIQMFAADPEVDKEYPQLRLDNQGVTLRGDSLTFNGIQVATIDDISSGVGQETPEGGEIFNNYENNKATNSKAHAEGHWTTASGIASHAEGLNSTASGKASHAEGWETFAEKDGSHAEGIETKAMGQGSHAEGYDTTASDNYSHAEGFETQASGKYSHAEGRGSQAKGEASHASGYDAIAEGEYSFAHGINAHAVVKNSYALGTDVVASGIHSFVTGNEAQANGNESFATGYATIANGDHSFAEGALTIAEGINAHASGQLTIAKGDNSYAGGYGTYGTSFTALLHSGFVDANGYINTLVNIPSSVTLNVGDHIVINYESQTQIVQFTGFGVVEDEYYFTPSLYVGEKETFVDADCNINTINATEAAHDNSFAHGVGVQTGRDSQAVFGRYNEVNDDALFIVGAGSGPNSYPEKHNALEVGQSKINIHATNDGLSNADISIKAYAPAGDGASEIIVSSTVGGNPGSRVEINSNHVLINGAEVITVNNLQIILESLYPGLVNMRA